MAGGVNRKGFERLIKRHLEPAMQLAIRLTGDQDAADEIVQETMLKAVRSWTSFRGQSQFKTWLFRIMINAFRDRLKRQKRVRENSEPAGDGQPDTVHAKTDSVEASLEAKELNEVVTLLISRLPERQREVLILSSYQQLSNEEIAATLEIKLANVHSNLSTARKKLKQQLAPYVNKP